MKNFFLSRWFLYTVEVILIILFGLSAYFSKNIILIASIGIFSIFLLTFRNIKESKRDKDEKEAKEFDKQEREKIKENLQNISLKKSETENLIRILINEGVINDNDLLKKVKEETFISLYCYQKSLPKKISKIIGKQPILDILSDLKFYRLGANHNFYLINEKELPKEIKSLKNLELFISDLLKERWELLIKKIEKEDKGLYEHYKDKEFWNFSYFMAKILSGNSLVGQLHWNSFTPESKAHLLKDINFNKIKEKIDYHRVTDILKKLNFKLLVRDFSTEDKNELSKLKKVKESLGVEEFKDYGRIPQSKYEGFFGKHFNSEKAKYYSEMISRKAQKFNDALDKFGIVFLEKKQ